MCWTLAAPLYCAPIQNVGMRLTMAVCLWMALSKFDCMSGLAGSLAEATLHDPVLHNPASSPMGACMHHEMCFKDCQARMCWWMLEFP